MIKFENTDNLTGVSLIGDYYDFYNLVEAFHTITVDDYSEKNTEYIEMSIRVLGVCYDIRHAYQGDREVVFMDNNMDDDKMKYHSIISSTKNVYYKCNLLYPEMLYLNIALNRLVLLRMQELSKTKQLDALPFNRKVIWDDTIAVIRNFQAEFAKCVKEILTERKFVLWLGYMNDEQYIEYMYHQYLDLINLEYLDMSKEKRINNFNKITRRIANYPYDEDHMQIKLSADEAAKMYNCHKSEIIFSNMDYPEFIEW
ncbi:MAG: hypothetical protein GX339_09935 [Tissierellia bacterium]|nr:hypothetical protein [Tissierellia bacterium]